MKTPKKETLSSDFFSYGGGEDAPQKQLPALEEEVQMIGDPKIRSLVRFVLSGSETIWFAPVSPDADDYPPDEYEEGGLILHTLRTIRAFALMEPTLELSSKERDWALAALLMRNATKFIVTKQGDEPILTFDPFYVYTIDGFIEYLFAEAQQNGDDVGEILGVTLEDLNMIMTIIHSSNGWLSPIRETFPVTTLQKAVHFADLLAGQAYNLLYLGQDTEDE